MKWMRMSLIACSLALFAVTACDDDEEPQEEIIDEGWGQTDRTFVTNANEGNRAEIELGALAATKASHEGVKAFGQMMVDEHGEALDELEGIANDQDFNLSTELSEKHAQLKARLDTLNGLSFDTAYINSQVKAHHETIDLFENESDNGGDQRLINYSNKYLPHIRMHLHKADSLKAILDNTDTDGE